MATPTRNPIGAGATAKPRPDDYFDPGEILILRSYLGLRPRKSDPPLSSLYEAVPDPDADEDELPTGPVRLRKVASYGHINDVSCAVARICLAGAQDRLPQFATSYGTSLVLGRHEFSRRDSSPLPPEPRRLLCINWADSGPGISWPEDYFVTALPGLGRYVVTASVDSIDSYGVTDFAIGHFPHREDVLAGSRRILVSLWRRAARGLQHPWVYLFQEGLFDSDQAREMRSEAWKGTEQEEG